MITVVGGGLAGCEAAWQIASRDIDVKLYEMRPVVKSEGHVTDRFGELVCKNYLGQLNPERPSGYQIQELSELGSFMVECAMETRFVRPGKDHVLSVVKKDFSELVTERIENNPRIEVVRQEVTSIPDGPTIIATGPLTSDTMRDSLSEFVGGSNIQPYNSIFPVVFADSVDFERLGRFESMEAYQAFVRALVDAEKAPLHDLEKRVFIDALVPIEDAVREHFDDVLEDPEMLDLENLLVLDDMSESLYKLEGFQTQLRYGEQKRVFRMIPGLEQAEFVLYGQYHRDTLINAPRSIHATLQSKSRDSLFFAGQITGVMEYVGAFSTGWLAGTNAARFVKGEELLTMPRDSMLGALCHYVANSDPDNFQGLTASYYAKEFAKPPFKFRPTNLWSRGNNKAKATS